MKLAWVADDPRDGMISIVLVAQLVNHSSSGPEVLAEVGLTDSLGCLVDYLCSLLASFGSLAPSVEELLPHFGWTPGTAVGWRMDC